MVVVAGYGVAGNAECGTILCSGVSGGSIYLHNLLAFYKLPDVRVFIKYIEVNPPEYTANSFECK